MNKTHTLVSNTSLQHIRWLTYMMFFMFAMTSDAVGMIIPELIKEFNLSMTQASAFHYAPMALIALSGLFLGFLADSFGRKQTIMLGLFIFSISCFLFAISSSFLIFVILLCLIGLAIGLFKTGALALLGDISQSNNDHTKTMNKVEGFFGIGAIVGPALVSFLLTQQVSWTYLYIIAGVMCLILAVLAWLADYPPVAKTTAQPTSFATTMKMVKNPYALGFSLAIALYVATEVAIYVWMPTLLADYTGSWTLMATYALTIFFILRAAGRFIAVWLLNRFSWQSVMVWLSLGIALCYVGTLIGGVNAAVLLLPLSGLFMSMVYPTLNSKGISCFAVQQHGAVAGVILFFTALSAALAPLFMGMISDMFGHVRYGFILATGFAVLLFLAMLYNYFKDPSAAALHQISPIEE
ncbi:MFS transporter [Pseudoalteromonas shioyasakiensis]|uniref:MFS transporter n=1 Tax=Pseudoalteromonas shioyasakiensis TaxID=1190813 RepID=UPI0021187C71|nr:MFS transporter [Pseudoalteromonas shioyasakiensis]MCQ8878701.1 MFS transporter [Pseudoalteromonas shioyasakiensis]